MGQIRLEQAQPGMQLASDALDRDGQLLAKAGNELTEKELRLFKIWGVQTIEIVGDDDPPEAQDNDPGLVIEAHHIAAARELFRHCNFDHPVVALLFDECTRRLAGRGNNGA